MEHERARNEHELADQLFDMLGGLDDPKVVARLKLRVRDLGPRIKDEVRQFRQLQKACRESAPLASALEARGFPEVTRMNPARPGPEGGTLIQAFNRMVETRWEP